MTAVHVSQGLLTVKNKQFNIPAGAKYDGKSWIIIKTYQLNLRKTVSRQLLISFITAGFLLTFLPWKNMWAGSSTNFSVIKDAKQD